MSEDGALLNSYKINCKLMQPIEIRHLLQISEHFPLAHQGVTDGYLLAKIAN